MRHGKRMRRRTLLIGGAVAIAGGSVAASFARSGSPASYDEAMRALRRPLDGSGGMREAIRFATLAANGHNTQPWRFRLSGKSVTMLPDFSRRTPVVDPDDHHLFTSLGCAAENLSIAAAALGQPGEWRFDDTAKSATFDFAAASETRSPLLDAIPRRQSARAEFSGAPVQADDLKKLEAAGKIAGADLVLLIAQEQIGQVRDLIVAGNSAQLADRAFVAELKAWLRFNPRAAIARGDGLYAASSGNPVLPDWLGSILFDLAFSANTENEKYVRQLNSAAGIAVFSSEKQGPRHWFDVGRACQRFALTATTVGLKHSFVNQPVEVAKFRPTLASLIGLPGRRPNLVMRFGYGGAVPFSPRRPVEAVIEA
jgi:nitroreductase